MSVNYWHVSSSTSVIAYPNGVKLFGYRHMTVDLMTKFFVLGHDFRPDYANLGKTFFSDPFIR